MAEKLFCIPVFLVNLRIFELAVCLFETASLALLFRLENDDRARD
jgi:hypothetical protein